MAEYEEQPEVREEPEESEEKDLAEAAASLRREIMENRRQPTANDFPRGRKIFYFVSVVVVLGCTFLILGSASVRRAVVTAAALRIVGNPDSSAEVFPLPAPPPKAPRVSEAAAAAAFSTAGGNFEGVLYADSSPTPAQAGTGENPGGGVEKKFVPPPKSPEAAQAYALLQSKSEVAAAVIKGQREDFKFKNWMPRKVDPPVFWIDVVTERASDGQEVHLIWQVNTASGDIQPLSQEARDLAH